MKNIITLSILSFLFVAFIFIPFNVLAEEKVLKMASWGPEAHYASVVLKVWNKEVNEALADEIKIQDNPGGKLFGPKDMQMAVSKGFVDIGVILEPSLLAMVPIIQGVFFPFVFDSIDDQAKAYSGESLAIIEKAMKKNKIKLLYIIYLDGSQIYSNKKNIETMEDFKGLKVLSISPIANKIYSRLGAIPHSFIPVTDWQMALKRGISDASANGIVAGYFQKMFKVAPYVTKVDFVFPTLMVGMNLDKWNMLSESARDTMISIGKNQEIASLAMAKGWENKFSSELQKNGVTITRISPEERSKIKGLSMEMWKEWADKSGTDAQRLYEINSNL